MTVDPLQTWQGSSFYEQNRPKLQQLHNYYVELLVVGKQ